MRSFRPSCRLEPLSWGGKDLESQEAKEWSSVADQKRIKREQCARCGRVSQP